MGHRRGLRERPVSAVAPGQAAYEAKIRASLARTGSAEVDAGLMWDTYPESHHADWEAAAWATSSTAGASRITTRARLS
jgi:hypothetical protein